MLFAASPAADMVTCSGALIVSACVSSIIGVAATGALGFNLKKYPIALHGAAYEVLNLGSSVYFPPQQDHPHRPL